MIGFLESTSGSISYRGNDISEFTDEQLQQFRSECQIVFQNPDSSLNPKHTVRYMLNRPLKMTTDLEDEEREERIIELLNQVDLDKEYLDMYPHQLSGGEKQRLAIARAFAPHPSFVILDEPVSALDMSIQASILELLEDLRQKYNTTYLFISHDLSVITHVCDRIGVMYLGKVAEVGKTERVINPPYHPYTRVLLSSVPSLDFSGKSSKISLEGTVPSARDPPSGCVFHTRCPEYIGDVCEKEEPRLENMDSSSHQISCHHEQHKLDEPIDDFL